MTSGFALTNHNIPDYPQHHSSQVLLLFLAMLLFAYTSSILIIVLREHMVHYLTLVYVATAPHCHLYHTILYYTIISIAKGNFSLHMQLQYIIFKRNHEYQ